MRKRPWELHVIICLYLLILGVSISDDWFGRLDERQVLVLGAMALSQIGLFRGH